MTKVLYQAWLALGLLENSSRCFHSGWVCMESCLLCVTWTFTDVLTFWKDLVDQADLANLKCDWFWIITLSAWTRVWTFRNKIYAAWSWSCWVQLDVLFLHRLRMPESSLSEDLYCQDIFITNESTSLSYIIRVVPMTAGTILWNAGCFIINNIILSAPVHLNTRSILLCQTGWRKFLSNNQKSAHCMVVNLHATLLLENACCVVFHPHTISAVHTSASKCPNILDMTLWLKVAQADGIQTSRHSF